MRLVSIVLALILIWLSSQICAAEAAFMPRPEPSIPALKAAVEWLDLDIAQARLRLTLLDRELTELDELEAKLDLELDDSPIAAEVTKNIRIKRDDIRRSLESLHDALRRTEENRAKVRKELRRARGLEL